MDVAELLAAVVVFIWSHYVNLLVQLMIGFGMTETGETIQNKYAIKMLPYYNLEMLAASNDWLNCFKQIVLEDDIGGFLWFNG